jgi:hypothetical protein
MNPVAHGHFSWMGLNQSSRQTAHHPQNTMTCSFNCASVPACEVRTEMTWQACTRASLGQGDQDRLDVLPANQEDSLLNWRESIVVKKSCVQEGHDRAPREHIVYFG